MATWLGAPRRAVRALMLGGCLLLAGGGGAAALASAPAARSAGVPACASANTRVWLGLGEGGGTAGTIYYPLEFSNVGHATCTLYGYPGVSAYGSGGAQVGQAARRNSGHPATVTLGPGASAHALLGIVDAGAVCSPVKASGLKVYAPGQQTAQQIPFGFAACAHASVLNVDPLRGGAGIPGYTTS